MSKNIGRNKRCTNSWKNISSIYCPVKGFDSYCPTLKNMRGVPLKDMSKVTSLLTYYTILSARVDEPSLQERILWRFILPLKGKEAYRFYQQNNVTTQNIEQILTTAYSLLKTEMEKNAPDAEHVIHALNTKYGKGRALFHSPELKRQIHHILNTK